MADERDAKVQEALQSSNIGQDIPNFPSGYREETASEVATPVTTQSSKYKEETAGEFGATRPLRVSLKKDEPATQIGASVPIRSRYKEENAAEIAAPVPVSRRITQTGENNNQKTSAAGSGLGTLAIALSILSLFVMPILFGAAGIILGFVARRRGADTLGAWAIGIGAISIIIGIFILPFF
ncbi:DUF4190 domain-containing protein [Neobacillus dielmonensis]|uniref:DUF4190 domain-containing protein n=1 Tax=Neobacillus dielmonensis TaxID=1347369 RepID=UPI000AEDDE63|nr:DUF4190 domain-containing protein [Neobacillus dielmonensis]